MIQEKIKKWCNDFEKHIFIPESIETSNVHSLADEYLKLKNENFSEKESISTLVKNDLLKRKAGLRYFGGSMNNFQKGLEALLESEKEDIDFSSNVEAFQKDIARSFWEKDDKSIYGVNIEGSSILYDLGIADWDYICNYFNNKIKGHYIQEAMSWVVAFVESNDYELSDIIHKNSTGKIDRKRTFDNIISSINERSLSNKTPFTKNKEGLYFYNSPKESIKVKMWNEKEQVAYGATSTKLRDYREIDRFFSEWLYIVGENAIINELKKKRAEKDVGAKRVKEYINMRDYTAIKKEMISKTKEKDDEREFLNDFFHHGFFEKLAIVRGFINSEKTLTDEIDSNEIKEFSQLINSKNVMTYYGNVLSKQNKMQDFYAGLFLSSWEDNLKEKTFFKNDVDLECFSASSQIKFSGIKNLNEVKKTFQKSIFDFFVKNKASVKDFLENISEKNAYSEERQLFFYSLNKILDDLNNSNIDNDSVIKKHFKELTDEQQTILKETLSENSAFENIKRKTDSIYYSQHENSIMKNAFEEKLYKFWISENPNQIGKHFSKFSQKKDKQHEFFKDVKRWSDEFVSKVLLSEDQKIFKEIIMDEYFDLMNKYSSKDVTGAIKSSLLSNKEILNHYKNDEEKIKEQVLPIFEGANEFGLNNEKIEKIELNPYIIKNTAESLKKHESLTHWGTVKSYFDKSISRSTVKEANGWLLGYLKHGDLNHYKIIKDDKCLDNIKRIIRGINDNATTDNQPLKINKNQCFEYTPAGAGDLDVEFWNPKTQKLHGMSITRHTGVEIEGNQFIRHAFKMFAKSLLINDKISPQSADDIKNTPIDWLDIKSKVNQNHLDNDVRNLFNKKDDFTVNLSIIREHINEKYKIDFHDQGFNIGASEMKVLCEEMNKYVGFSYFGEVSPSSSFPEINAGFSNIGYLYNLSSIGNFSLDYHSSKTFMDSINKYYNNISEKADVENTAKKALVNIVLDEPMSKHLIEYFSEPNSKKEERESFVQSFTVMVDCIMQNFNINDKSSLFKGIDSFFENSISNEDKNKLHETILTGAIEDNVKKALENMTLSPTEDIKRLSLLSDKMSVLNNVIEAAKENDCYYHSNESRNNIKAKMKI